MHHLCRLHVMPVAKAVGLPIEASYILIFLLSALLHEIPLAVSSICSNPLVPLTAHNRLTTYIHRPIINNTHTNAQLMFRTWRTYGIGWCWFGPAFWAMMVQMPLASLTSALVPKTKAGQMVGNLVFWTIFCGVIQPLVVRSVWASVCAWVARSTIL